jgi:Xaa-Pro aminopeptidase
VVRLSAVFDYAARRTRMDEVMAAEGVDLMFLGLGSDLEYLTGVERMIPAFGNISYAHGWVGGAFFRPGKEPVHILPRMFAEFDLPHGKPDNLVVVNEKDDGRAVFDKVANSIGGVKTLAIGSRLWGETVMNLIRVFGSAKLVNAEPLVNRLRRVKSKEELEVMTRACEVVDGTMGAVTGDVRPGVTMHELVERVEHEMRARGSRTPSFTTHINTFGEFPDQRESIDERGKLPLREGESVLFDFGAVVDGYCSDFGRTIFCGEPTAEYRRAHQAMIDAQAAGQAAARPGVTCAEVNRACRAPIEEAGFGSYFRHRMGHCIGMDVHERPFISEEDETPLEVGMTFTDEPSIMWHGRVGVRIENIVVCEKGGGRKLNSYPIDLVANS